MTDINIDFKAPCNNPMSPTFPLFYSTFDIPLRDYFGRIITV